MRGSFWGGKQGIARQGFRGGGVKIEVREGVDTRRWREGNGRRSGDTTNAIRYAQRLSQEIIHCKETNGCKRLIHYKNPHWIIHPRPPVFKLSSPGVQLVLFLVKYNAVVNCIVKQTKN